MLLTGFSKLKLYPEADYSEFTAPNQTVPRSPGFYKEWVIACQGGQAATCHFDYSGPLAETVMLGNLAYRSQENFDWDGEKLLTSSTKANAFIKTKYASGW